jgi:hypothetical protein
MCYINLIAYFQYEDMYLAILVQTCWYLFSKLNINHNCIIYNCNTSECNILKTNLNPVQTYILIDLQMICNHCEMGHLERIVNVLHKTIIFLVAAHYFVEICRPCTEAPGTFYMKCPLYIKQVTILYECPLY